MASIHSDKTTRSRFVPGEGAIFRVDYPKDMISLQPYWHVLSGWDTHDIGTLEEPAHLLGVISESPFEKLPESMIPEGMTVVATFDHDPTREELDAFVPDNYRDHLREGNK